MRNTLYLECCSGISGDMTVAALLDLGADERKLREVLESLKVDGYEIAVSRVKKSGLDACDFDVRLDTAHENHDHDMEFLHGHSHEYSHEHAHEHEHEHHHEHGYEHDHEHHHHEHSHTHSAHGHHAHEHRGLNDVLAILRSGTLSERALQYAERIFTVLAQAESKAHGVPMEEVHFHEVGAVDSIVDIAAVSVCLDLLDVDEIIVPYLYEGHGTIRCQHGIIPVPVPAVSHIVQDHKLKLHITSVQGELVTPTGAAIVAALKTSETLPQEFVIEKTGLGAGKRSYEGASGLLRAMLIRPSRQNQDVIWKLETNVDDCTGEQLGYVMDRLLLAGARDVNYMPVFMKKNRPAWQLNVICDENLVPVLEEIIFKETTTIGIRRQKMERTVLSRKVCDIMTSIGPAKVKICQNEGLLRCYPEYDTAAALAKETNLALSDVYHIIRTEAERQQKQGVRRCQ